MKGSSWRRRRRRFPHVVTAQKEQTSKSEPLRRPQPRPQPGPHEHACLIGSPRDHRSRSFVPPFVPQRSVRVRQRLKKYCANEPHIARIEFGSTPLQTGTMILFIRRFSAGNLGSVIFSSSDFQLLFFCLKRRLQSITTRKNRAGRSGGCRRTDGRADVDDCRAAGNPSIRRPFLCPTFR